MSTTHSSDSSPPTAVSTPIKVTLSVCIILGFIASGLCAWVFVRSRDKIADQEFVSQGGSVVAQVPLTVNDNVPLEIGGDVTTLGAIKINGDLHVQDGAKITSMPTRNPNYYPPTNQQKYFVHTVSGPSMTSQSLTSFGVSSMGHGSNLDCGNLVVKSLVAQPPQNPPTVPYYDLWNAAGSNGSDSMSVYPSRESGTNVNKMSNNATGKLAIKGMKLTSSKNSIIS